jgi:transposase-like protein
MAKEVVPMDVRLRIAVASETLNVAAYCREFGISRETFYVWRRRYQAEGLEGACQVVCVSGAA